MSSSADRLYAALLLIRSERGAYAGRMLGSRATPGVRARVLGVLRWLRALDRALAEFCRQPLDRLDAEVLAALRIGLFESVRLEVPTPVATDAAVHLVRRLGRSSAASLVNAVLRRSAEAWPEVVASAPLDIRLSHPAWLVERWLGCFGPRATEEMLAANQEPASVWVWFLNAENASSVVRRGTGLELHPWCPGAWTAPGETGALISEVEEGRAYVQDPSSQLVAHLAHRLFAGGGLAADLCAAPGGKTALLRSLNRELETVAVDLRWRRVRLMQPLLDRVGCSLTVVGDACRPPLADSTYDLVVLDAPCSGTGTLRRHPELRWRLRPDSIVERASLQRRLLHGGLGLVASGGVLVYSTCSIEAEENERLFDRIPDGFLFESLDAHLPVGTPSITTDVGGFRILPGPERDGFTIHALRRR